MTPTLTRALWLGYDWPLRPSGWDIPWRTAVHRGGWTWSARPQRNVGWSSERDLPSSWWRHQPASPLLLLADSKRLGTANTVVNTSLVNTYDGVLLCHRHPGTKQESKINQIVSIDTVPVISPPEFIKYAHMYSTMLHKVTLIIYLIFISFPEALGLYSLCCTHLLAGCCRQLKRCTLWSRTCSGM